MICSNCGNSVDSIHRFCPKCGAPVQAQAPPPVGGAQYNPPPYTAPAYTPGPPYTPGPTALPAKKSSGCGKWILIAVLILVVIGAVIAGAIYYGFRYTEKALKSSEAYTVAVKSLKENEEVQNQLGDIQETGFPIGAFSQNSDGSGTAAFVMSVKGTKGTGQYQVELTRKENVWHVVNGVLKTPNGETIRIGEKTLPYGEPMASPTKDSGPVTLDPRSKGAISGGVLNDKAVSLPKPVYPSIAKTAKASGRVVVQVLVDEDGNVIAAHAVSGHPLLQAAAVTAASTAKFTPTKVSGKPVKVIGVINYTFAL